MMKNKRKNKTNNKRRETKERIKRIINDEKQKKE